ncbi:MAG: hypothetical protein IJ723_07380, partial [Ruminococcus sp.]|nr:hypothetical protein [Ruminococcus sp.]
MSARSRNRSNPTGLIIGGIVIIAVALYMIAMGYLDDKKVASLKARCTENTIATVENVTSQTKTRV